MHRDPVTWSIEERIARCREQATFFESMAAAESRFVARDALMDLARQFNCLADALRESSQDWPRQGLSGDDFARLAGSPARW